MSVVFNFNASLNDAAPVSLILLPVDTMKTEKSELLMDFFCVSSFVLTPQNKFSESCV